jgi:tetratricopeptide (TPR) repeat protein
MDYDLGVSSRDIAQQCPGDDVLAAFVEGGLAPGEAASIEQHVDACPYCCALLASFVREQCADPTAPTLVPEPDPAVDEGANALERGALVGRYVLLERVGSGGMGIVWAAFDPQLDRRVAIKLLRPGRADAEGSEGRARLLREAQSMARLSHPNVVAVHDVGVASGDDSHSFVFVAMEFVEGETLGAWMRGGVRPWPAVLERFVAAGRGLAAAHEHGVVHRDFKPDNVLLGKNDRVCVTDFGLAHAHARAVTIAEDDLEVSDEVVGRLTQTGAFLGTPAYMAPEQFAGLASDARSDQFSFCVALWEALFGERPFAGRSIGDLATAVAEGRVRDPSSGARGVPSDVEAALRRGLSPVPSARFADMPSLLAVLGRDRHAWRRRGLTLGLAGALVGVTAWAAVRRPAAAAPCTGATQRMAGVWDDARAAEVRESLLATAVPYADATVANVGARIDEYAADWVAMHTDACEATTVRGEQSAALLDRRMACLEERRGSLVALVDVLAEADANVAERAVSAVGSLPSLDRCADADALMAELPPPDDPELAGRVEVLAATHRQLTALGKAGREREALDGYEALAPAAAELGFAPLAVEVQAQLGRLRAGTGDHEGAARDLTAAYELALEIGHDRIAARAAIDLIYVVGTKQVHIEEGKAWARHALALARRVGRGDEIEADARDELGILLLHSGDAPRGEEELARALAILEQKLGPDHDITAQTRSRHADALAARMDLATAEPEYLRAIDGLERNLGESHPQLAAPLVNLGGVYHRLNRFDDAERMFTRARAVQEGAFGPRHPDLLVTLTLLGNVAAVRGDLQGARAHYEHAREIAVAAFGEDSSQVGIAIANLGGVLRALGDLEGSREVLARTVQLWERDLGPDSPVLLSPLTSLALTLFDLGRVDEAVPVVERAVAVAEKAPRSPTERASVDLARAQMLWMTGRDKPRARAIAQAARNLLAAQDPPADAEIAELDRWLARHRLAD